MNSTLPLKRVPELQALSHDHHHGLLLCWKIRTGLAKQVEPQHIKEYVDWFFQKHLLPHFELEEKYIFTILAEDNELTKQAVTEHQRLKYLFGKTSDLETNLKHIEKELNAHIRFEERVLFAEIQKIATKAQLTKIDKIHSKEVFIEKENGDFWL